MDIHGPWLSSEILSITQETGKSDHPSTPPSSGPGDSTLSELAFTMKAQNYRKTAASGLLSALLRHHKISQSSAKENQRADLSSWDFWATSRRGAFPGSLPCGATPECALHITQHRRKLHVTAGAMRMESERKRRLQSIHKAFKIRTKTHRVCRRYPQNINTSE